MKQLVTLFCNFFKQHRVECIVYGLFLALAAFGFSVHDFFYDEAQSWQIARSASWYDIIFVLPHYEGHPPFWHLLLALPAKAGLAWNWGVGIIGFLLMAASGFLLIFKAPFPRWVRFCLPFSYFLFYQYGIIVRPYSVMVLVMLLLAVYFPQKDKRPGLFVALLAVLCACHILGIAIAGGIALAWLWQMRAGRTWKEYLFSLYKDIRFRYLLVLLVFVVIVFASMWQEKGSVLAQYAKYTASIPKQITYLLLAMPADAVLTNFMRSSHIMLTRMQWGPMIPACAVGLLMWGLVFACLPRKNWMYLVLPYLLMCGIMLHYSGRHHIGLALLLGVWYCWISLPQDPPAGNIAHLLRRVGLAMVAMGGLVSISWTMGILYYDSKYVYFPGKDMVSFFNKYQLTDKTIFVAWDIVGAGGYVPADPHFIYMATLLNMYTPHNIVANFHNGEDKGYLINIRSTEDELKQAIMQWKAKGLPDVLVGATALDMLYANGPELISKYRLAHMSVRNHMWKLDHPFAIEIPIYLREDWWDKYKDQILAEAGQGA